MATRVRIFDYYGNGLADIDCECPRSWVLNKAGQARLIIAKTDAKCTERNLRYGNLILIEHDRAGNWGGVLWTPRNWAENSIVCTAYTAEYLLNHRIGTKEQAIEGDVGTIFTLIINMANTAGDTRIRMGEVFHGRANRDQLVYMMRLYDVIISLIEETGKDWGMEPEIGMDGRLLFRANLYSQRGSLQPQILQEGLNLERIDSGALIEQGDIVNEANAFGYGATNDIRELHTASDADSQALYGLRQSVITVNSEQDSTIQDAANSELAAKKNPKRSYKLTAIDVNSTFDYLGLGNTLPLNFVKYGFTDEQPGIRINVRIMAKSFDDNTGEMSLVVQEV